MRLNVWLSYKGIRDSRFEFPYEAKVSSGTRRFESINDVYDEILAVEKECEENGFDNIGEAIYLEHLFWANSKDLIDKDAQYMIKVFMYCNSTRTAPFQSFDITPANFIDDYMIIDDEINKIKKAENECK